MKVRLSCAALSLFAAVSSFATVTTTYRYSDGPITEPITSYWKGVAFNMYAKTSWANGAIPGRFTDYEIVTDDNGTPDDPSDDTVTTNKFINGCYGCTAIFDGMVADGGHRTGTYNRLDGTSSWDGDGLKSVKYAIFKKGCLSHTFYDWGFYCFEEDGGIYVEEDAPYALKVGNGARIVIVDVTKTDPKFTICNDSTNAVRLQSTAWIKNNKSGGVVRMDLRFEGKGDIRFDGGWKESSYNELCFLTVAQTNDAKVIYKSPADSSKAYTNPIYPTHITFAAGTGKRVFELQSWTTQQTCYDAIAVIAHTDADILGPGTLSLAAGDNTNHEQPAMSVDPGCTLRVSALLKNRGGNRPSTGLPRGLVLQGGGTVECLDGMTSPIPGPFQIATSTTLKTPAIGNSGLETTPLGKYGEIRMTGAGAKLLYTGAGETTDRKLNLTAAGTVENAGEGTLTFASAIGEKALTVVGKVAFADAVAAPLVLADGAELAAAGDLASVQVAPGGTATLAVAEGGDVTIAAAPEGGVLNVVAGEGAAVKLAGFVSKAAPAWVKMNGLPAAFDSDGKLVAYGTITDAIDAHGGVVPDDADAQVSIATAEGPADKNVTLASSATSVLYLEQKQAVVDAKLVLDADETLSVGRIEIADGAKDLVVAGEGAIAGDFDLKGDGLVRVNETDGTSVRLVAEDAAKVALGGDLSESAPLDLTVKAGSLAVTGEGTLENAKLKVETAAGAVAATELSVGGGFSAALDPESDLVVSGRLSVANATLMRRDTTYNGHGIKIANPGVPAVLEVGEGAVITNLIRLSSASVKDLGILRQTGGAVVSKYKANDRYNAHYCGYCYQQLTGGSFLYDSGVVFGSSASQSMIYQTGGKLAFNNGSDHIVMGNWDTQFHFYQTGGTVTGSSCYMPFWNSNNNHADDQVSTVLTVEGAAATNIINTFYVGNFAGASLTDNVHAHLNAINVNDGGTLCAYSVALAVQRPALAPRGRTYLNFNGGRFRLHNGNTANLFGSNSSGLDWRIPHIMIYEGGFLFDTFAYSVADVRNASTQVGFEKPYGKGLTAVEIPAAVADRVFAGPPAVSIIGDGEGASAVVLFDDASGKVTGVKVTSHGVGYTTAKARWCYEGLTFRTDSTVTLADNLKDGGFRLTGGGTFTIENGAFCTYEGPTVIDAGILALGTNRTDKSTVEVTNLLNPATGLVLNGGKLDLRGNAQTFSDITFNGGTIVNGKPTVSGLTVDFDAVKAGAVKKVDIGQCDFAPGAAVSVVNYDASKIGADDKRFTLVDFTGGVPDPMLALPTLDLPEGWVLKMSGNRLMIKRDIGLMLIVR